MNLREREPLSRHTTLRTGGPARFFVEAETEADWCEAMAFARARNLALFVLGGGSNLLVRDEGFDGLVLKICTRGIRTADTSAGGTEVTAEAGETWDELVAFAVERGFCGLENLSLIPGTVGAAVIGNIGAYGAEVKETLLWVEALDRRSGSRRRFSSGECAFAYRHSMFKTPEGRNYIVTRAAFGLKRGGSLITGYHDVQEHFRSRGVVAPTLAQMREAVISIRRRKLPELERIGTAGSWFKNPVIARTDYEALTARYPGLPGHDEGNGRMKIPLGWVLDKVCGLRGVRQGRVGTHSQQALVIVNDGGSAAEVEAFANDVARKVKDQTGLDIEWEVEKV